MKTIHNNLILLLFLFAISCTSISEDEIITDTPPPTDTIQTSPPVQSKDVINLINDTFAGSKYIVIGSKSLKFMLAFNTSLNGNNLTFEALQNRLPIVMQDNLGNQYDIFGKVSNGPNVGEKLTPMNAFIGYWFSWGTFYPGLEIYGDAKTRPNLGKSVAGSDDWLIPKDKVFRGASRDGIPAIDDPKFVTSKGEKRPEDELMVGVRINNTSKAYPHGILNWHEIVNDKIDDVYFSVVYCPLTGTATVWDRNINGQITTFGVSGFLYNSNVVPYDRNTNSNWSQMLQKSVQGTLSGNNADNLLVLETSLSTWKLVAGNFSLLSTKTGYSRDYGRNPYGNYPTNKTINFPINFEDNRLNPKERVLGVIIKGNAKAYRFSSF